MSHARRQQTAARGAVSHARPRHAAARGPLGRLAAALAGTATALLLAVAAGQVAQASEPDAAAFRGTPAAGALFVISGGKLRHICTAAVVASPTGDLAITAAHCLDGLHLGPRGDVFFAPGYYRGKFRYGRWRVESKFVDSAWRTDKNPNDDVAFFVVHRRGRRIQRMTGAEQLLTGARVPQIVQVIGYPDRMNRPVRCIGKARLLRTRVLRQLVFDCGGFTGGTSGSPFLIRVNKKTGTGQVIGVIGGYQRGGNTASISYSSRFLTNVADLYRRATR